MEDIAAEISAVKAEISTVTAEISTMKAEISRIEATRNEKGLSDPELAELTALRNTETALRVENAALRNIEVELLRRLPAPGIHTISMPYFINNLSMNYVLAHALHQLCVEICSNNH